MMTRGKNKGRPSDAYLMERIERIRKKLMAYKGTTVGRADLIDSLSWYTQKYREPVVTDDLGRKITDASEIFGFGTKDVIRYKGLIQVTFKREAEENNYTVEKPPLKTQQSVINFLNQIKIYENGYYEKVNDVFFDGYMGWSEKLAELLPQEYMPAEKETEN